MGGKNQAQEPACENMSHCRAGFANQQAKNRLSTNGAMSSDYPHGNNEN